MSRQASSNCAEYRQSTAERSQLKQCLNKDKHLGTQAGKNAKSRPEVGEPWRVGPSSFLPSCFPPQQQQAKNMEWQLVLERRRNLKQSLQQQQQQQQGPGRSHLWLESTSGGRQTDRDLLATLRSQLNPVEVGAVKKAKVSSPPPPANRRRHQAALTDRQLPTSRCGHARGGRKKPQTLDTDEHKEPKTSIRHSDSARIRQLAGTKTWVGQLDKSVRDWSSGGRNVRSKAALLTYSPANSDLCTTDLATACPTRACVRLLTGACLSALACQHPLVLDSCCLVASVVAATSLHDSKALGNIHLAPVVTLQLALLEVGADAKLESLPLARHASVSQVSTRDNGRSRARLRLQATRAVPLTLSVGLEQAESNTNRSRSSEVVRATPSVQHLHAALQSVHVALVLALGLSDPEVTAEQLAGRSSCVEEALMNRATMSSVQVLESEQGKSSQGGETFSRSSSDSGFESAPSERDEPLARPADVLGEKTEVKPAAAGRQASYVLCRLESLYIDEDESEEEDEDSPYSPYQCEDFTAEEKMLAGMLKDWVNKITNLEENTVKELQGKYGDLLPKCKANPPEQLKVRTAEGKRDQGGRLCGEVEIYYENGDYFWGDIVDGRREGMASVVLKNGDNYVGRFKDDQLEGYVVETIGHCDSDNVTREVFYSHGVRHGFYREHGPCPGGRQFWSFGKYLHGSKAGVQWLWQKGNGYIVGDTNENNRPVGDSILYLYSDLSTVLQCQYNSSNQRMKAGRLARLTGLDKEYGVVVPEVAPVDHSPVFSYEPSSAAFITKRPLLRDPYEQRYVYVAPSGNHFTADLIFKLSFCPQ